MDLKKRENERVARKKILYQHTCGCLGRDVLCLFFLFAVRGECVDGGSMVIEALGTRVTRRCMELVFDAARQWRFYFGKMDRNRYASSILLTFSCTVFDAIYSTHPSTLYAMGYTIFTA